MRSAAQLKAALLPIIQDYGFETLAIGPMDNPFSRGFKRRICSTVSDDWLKVWLEDELHVHDPVFHFAMRHDDPFYFHEAYAAGKLSKQGRYVVDVAQQYGIVDGYHIKLNGWVFSMSAVEHIQLQPEQEAELMALAWPAIRAWRQLLKDASTTVEEEWTPREREIMWRLAAADSDTHSIASEVGVTDSTYWTIRKRAMSKTGGGSLATVLIKAIKNRWIP
ncbi:MAG: autoinducer binding domain-containing protein [bacterium]